MARDRSDGRKRLSSESIIRLLIILYYLSTRMGRGYKYPMDGKINNLDKLQCKKYTFMPRNKSYDENIVLERAMNVFWSNGYKATLVRLLEKEMGINQFSIYSSFYSKKKLFIESIRRYRDHVKQNVYQALLQDDAGMKELEQFLNKSARKKREFVFRPCRQT